MNAPAEQTSQLQESLGTDFGLYKCDACKKVVVGFDLENHVRGNIRGVEWKKVK